jgi:SAM-dependent methyltransferase
MAADYDADFSQRLPVKWLRESIYRQLAPFFNEGSHIVELGCGSGDDAIWFAKQGCWVYAIDASARMLEKAQSKINATECASFVRLEKIDLGQWCIERSSTPRGVDIVFSNFGVLNCVEDLRPVFEGAAQCLKPGGIMAVTVMGRFCLSDMLYFGGKGQFRKASRRRSGSSEFRSGDKNFPVWYHAPGRLAATAIGFQRLHTYGIGAFLPTSEAYHLCEQWPRLFARIARFDHHLSRFSYAISDHYLMILRKPDLRS